MRDSSRFRRRTLRYPENTTGTVLLRINDVWHANDPTRLRLGGWGLRTTQNSSDNPIFGPKRQQKQPLEARGSNIDSRNFGNKNI